MPTPPSPMIGCWAEVTNQNKRKINDLDTVM